MWKYAGMGESIPGIALREEGDTLTDDEFEAAVAALAEKEIEVDRADVMTALKASPLYAYVKDPTGAGARPAAPVAASGSDEAADDSGEG